MPTCKVFSYSGQVDLLLDTSSCQDPFTDSVAIDSNCDSVHLRSISNTRELQHLGATNCTGRQDNFFSYIDLHGRSVAEYVLNLCCNSQALVGASPDDAAYGRIKYNSEIRPI